MCRGKRSMERLHTFDDNSISQELCAGPLEGPVLCCYRTSENCYVDSKLTLFWSPLCRSLARRTLRTTNLRIVAQVVAERRRSCEPGHWSHLWQWMWINLGLGLELGNSTGSKGGQGSDRGSRVKQKMECGSRVAGHGDEIQLGAVAYLPLYWFESPFT